MTLREMSSEYRASAALLSAMLRPLRARLRTCGDPDERLRLFGCAIVSMCSARC